MATSDLIGEVSKDVQMLKIHAFGSRFWGPWLGKDESIISYYFISQIAWKCIENVNKSTNET